MKQDDFLEKIGNIIKEDFPFYTTYKIHPIRNGEYYEISVYYYYMGKNTVVRQIIPKCNLKREKVFEGFKDFLTSVRKDLISYPNNETQQDFLRKKRD